ncbi:MAG: hypothetical protein LCH68_14385 [Proteobacteria bacterium]|nr:hypothetical protein [Pseudomonadota bacterium]
METLAVTSRRYTNARRFPSGGHEDIASIHELLLTFARLPLRVLFHAVKVRSRFARAATTSRSMQVAADETDIRTIAAMTYLTTSEINALIDALESGLPMLYQTVQPSDRQEAFAADANGILDLAAPEDHLRVFARLEAIVLKTDGFSLPLAANS